MRTRITLMLTALVLSLTTFAASYNLPGTGTVAWSGLSSSFFSQFNDYDELVIPAGRTLKIDGASCNELAGVEIIVRVYGTLGWATNGSSNSSLYLNANSTILLGGNGQVYNWGNCDDKKRLYFGSTIIATCDGSSSSSSTAYYTFQDINTAGGIGGSGPVPVTWLNYEAVQMTSGVQINWSTATEINNSHFEIEYSTDGENWIFVDLVQSKAENGRSESILEYSYDHIAELSGTVYYRIKQVDYDNDFEYTEVMALKLTEKPKVVIATQGEGKISLNVESKTASVTTVRVFDLSGNLVNELELTDFAELTLDEPNIYIFEFTKNKVTDVIKHYVL
jgi:hypothetical protein